MKDPKKFVAEVAEVDPAALSNIITLLEGLLTTSQDTEADLINKVNDETQKSLQTAEHVMDAERALEDAEALQTTAEQNLENAKAVVQTKQQQLAQRKQDHDDQKARQDLAQKEHDDVIDSLNNEQQVLIDVIRMLKELHESQNAEESPASATDNYRIDNCQGRMFGGSMGSELPDVWGFHIWAGKELYIFAGIEQPHYKLVAFDENGQYVGSKFTTPKKAPSYDQTTPEVVLDEWTHGTVNNCRSGGGYCMKEITGCQRSFNEQ